LAGFQVSDPNQASADRYVAGYDFLDLTFYIITSLMPEIHGDRRVVDRFSQPQSRAGSR
jgi:hypothetical protein